MSLHSVIVYTETRPSIWGAGDRLGVVTDDELCGIPRFVSGVVTVQDAPNDVMNLVLSMDPTAPINRRDPIQIPLVTPSGWFRFPLPLSMQRRAQFHLLNGLQGASSIKEIAIFLEVETDSASFQPVR